MMIPHYSTWPGRSPRFDSTVIHAIVSVPLRWQDHIIGTLNVGSKRKDYAFSQDDIRLVELFASQAAIAINNWRMAEAEWKARQHTEALLHASLSLSSSRVLNKTITCPLGILGSVQRFLFVFHLFFQV